MPLASHVHDPRQNTQTCHWRHTYTVLNKTNLSTEHTRHKNDCGFAHQKYDGTGHMPSLSTSIGFAH
jgi:hypothetical protein